MSRRRQIASLLGLAVLLLFARLWVSKPLRSTAINSQAVVSHATETPAVAVTGRVAFVADGDSFEMHSDAGETIRVRMFGIDAPERGQGFSNQARQALIKRIQRQRVEVRRVDTDPYGRLVGEVYCDGVWINRAMVEDGWAWHYTHFSSSPDLAQAEREARNAMRGLWRDKQPVPPWEWRRQRPRKQAN